MCPQCQAPVRSDADFCTNCGAPLNRAAANPPPFGQPTQQPPTQYPQTQYPQTQQPQAQYPQAQYPQTQYPQTQYPQTQYPQTQQPQAPQPQDPQAQYPQAQQPQTQAPPAQQPFNQPYRAPAQQPLNQPAPGWPGQVRPAAAPFQFNLKRLGTTDLIIGGASVVVLISVFMPWFGYLGATVSGMTAHGYLGISLLVSLALIAYLVLRAGWDALPFKLPVARGPLLLVGTGVQLFFVLIAFLFKPLLLSWEIGAYLGLLAAVVACAVIAVPAIKSLRGTQR